MVFIESGIKLPPKPDRPGYWKYPFHQMKPGDSLPFSTPKAGKNALAAAKVYAHTHHPDWTFVGAPEVSGWRVWRVS
jgi:hypothetical protein